MKTILKKLSIIILVASISHPIYSQQFMTDDAAMVEFKAIQVEAWHGKNASYILPAVRLISPIALTIGAGFLNEGNVRKTDLQLQTKSLFRELSTNSFGVGLVAGTNLRLNDKKGINASNLYAYIPYSHSFFNDIIVSHNNLGWGGTLSASIPIAHSITMASRLDVTPLDFITIWGEVLIDNFSFSQYQVGTRLEIIKTKLASTISYHSNVDDKTAGNGFTIGVQWTPAPWF